MESRGWQEGGRSGPGLDSLPAACSVQLPAPSDSTGPADHLAGSGGVGLPAGFPLPGPGKHVIWKADQGGGLTTTPKSADLPWPLGRFQTPTWKNPFTPTNSSIPKHHTALQGSQSAGSFPFSLCHFWQSSDSPIFIEIKHKLSHSLPQEGRELILSPGCRARG